MNCMSSDGKVFTLYIEVIDNERSVQMLMEICHESFFIHIIILTWISQLFSHIYA